MTQIEQIKAEIERLIDTGRYGSIFVLKDLLSFIEQLEKEKPFPNWRHIDDEKPKQGQYCACVSVTYDGDIKYHNFEDGPWWWDANGKLFDDDDEEPGVFVGHDDWGSREPHTCSYWMPWDELFDMLEKPFKERAHVKQD